MKYFIYARKSTEDEDRQVLSIESQLTELQEFAAKEKLEIAASFQEAKTAKEPDKNIGSNHILQNRQLIFSPKIPFNLVASLRSATHKSLTFPYWLRILKLVRTFFAPRFARGGGKGQKI